MPGDCIIICHSYLSETGEMVFSLCTNAPWRSVVAWRAGSSKTSVVTARHIRGKSWRLDCNWALSAWPPRRFGFLQAIPSHARQRFARNGL